MGAPLSERQQGLVARIVRERLSDEEVSDMLADLPEHERVVIRDALAAVRRWTVGAPRARRATARVRTGGR